MKPIMASSHPPVTVWRRPMRIASSVPNFWGSAYAVCVRVPSTVREHYSKRTHSLREHILCPKLLGFRVCCVCVRVCARGRVGGCVRGRMGAGGRDTHGAKRQDRHTWRAKTRETHMARKTRETHMARQDKETRRAHRTRNTHEEHRVS